jgi:major type 1 subunit fimbrin (pilin)
MPVARASDGTVNFSGTLLNTTCTISVNNGTNVGTVTLPTLAAATLGAAGATAGRTLFTIGLSGCGSKTSIMDNAPISSATAYFENGPGVDPVTSNILNASGSATGVQLQLTNYGGAVIKPGDSTQLGVIGVKIASGGTSGVMRYQVQYIATTATTAGSVAGSVTYSIVYN